MKKADKNFLKQLIYNRVERLLKRKPNETIRKRIHAGHDVIDKLEKREWLIVNDMLDAMAERAADNEVFLYKRGLLDGIRFMKWLSKL